MNLTKTALTFIKKVRKISKIKGGFIKLPSGNRVLRISGSMQKIIGREPVKTVFSETNNRDLATVVHHR